MSDPLLPPQTRIFINRGPFLRALGCGGCGLGCFTLSLIILVLGGLLGLLLFGWKTLLGG